MWAPLLKDCGNSSPHLKGIVLMKKKHGEGSLKPGESAHEKLSVKIGSAVSGTVTKFEFTKFLYRTSNPRYWVIPTSEINRVQWSIEFLNPLNSQYTKIQIAAGSLHINDGRTTFWRRNRHIMRTNYSV
jgi:hypothetical protein